VLKLEGYILNALKINDFIIIPEFGAFLLNGKSSEILADGILQPGKVISFNNSITQNDGFLQSFISLNSEMSFEEASAFIRSNVTYWNQKLFAGHSLFLNDIGALEQIGSKTLFTPSFSRFIDNSTFGLYTVKLIKLKSPEYVATNSLTIKSKTKRFRLWQIAAIAIAILCVLSISIYPNKDLQKASFLESINLNTTNETENINQPVVKNEIDTNNQDSINTVIVNNSVENEKTVTKEIATENFKFFYVIANSFGKKENAEKQLKLLIASGYDAEIVISDPNKFRVSYFKSTDSLQADKYLQDIAHNKNSSAWLLNK